jgi:SAM-dependent methyltransferase
MDEADPSLLYEALASVYDDWQRADNPTPFSDALLAKLEPVLAPLGDGGSFIDFGCGTGTLLHALRARHPGWRLAGVDATAGMLAAARAKPGAASIDWLHARLGEPAGLAAPELRSSFDAAGCFYDTLNHLPDTAALARALGDIAACLRPGALFVCDLTNDGGYEAWWRTRRSWHGPGWRVAVDMTYDPHRRRAEARVAVDRGRIRTTATLLERCFAETEWRTAMDGAGLDVLSATPWNPIPDDALGKTLIISSKRR